MELLFKRLKRGVKTNVQSVHTPFNYTEYQQRREKLLLELEAMKQPTEKDIVLQLGLKELHLHKDGGFEWMDNSIKIEACIPKPISLTNMCITFNPIYTNCCSMFTPYPFRYLFMGGPREEAQNAIRTRDCTDNTNIL